MAKEKGKCEYLYIGGMRVPMENLLITYIPSRSVSAMTQSFRVAAKSPGKDRGEPPYILTIKELKKLLKHNYNSKMMVNVYDPKTKSIVGKDFNFDPSKAHGRAGRKLAAKGRSKEGWGQFTDNEFVAGILAKGVSYGNSKELTEINTAQLDWLARTPAGVTVLDNILNSTDPSMKDIKCTLAGVFSSDGVQKVASIPFSSKTSEAFDKLTPLAVALGFAQDAHTTGSSPVNNSINRKEILIRGVHGIENGRVHGTTDDTSFMKPATAKPRVVHPGLPDGMGILDASTVARETAGGYKALVDIPKILKSGAMNIEKLDTLKVNNKLVAEQSSSSDRIELVEKFKGLDIFEYEENGLKKRIVFGQVLESDTLKDATDLPTVVPMSPYDISGLSRQSEEGRQIAYDYTYALAATKPDTTGIEVGEYGVSQVNALLYAGSRGDTKALAEFEKMVETGRQKVAIEKVRLSSTGDPGISPGSRVDPFIKIYPDRVTPGTAAYKALLEQEGQAGVERIKANYDSSTGAHIDECIQTAKAIGLYAENVTQTDTSNLFLFHEKELSMGDFEINENGDLLLRPVEHWQTTDSGIESFNEQNPDLPPFAKGDPRAKYYRRTVHLGINGPVAPVINNGGLAGGRVVTSAVAVMVRLDDVVKENPGSVDNITSYDTFLTPPSGRPLVIPKGKYKVLSRDQGEDWTVDGGATTVEDVAVSLGADRDKFAAQQFKRRGDLPDSVPGSSAALSRVAAGKYKAGYSGHDGTVQHNYERFPVGRGKDPILTAYDIASSSQNWASSHYDCGIVLGQTEQEVTTISSKEAIKDLEVEVVTRYDF